MPTYEFSCQDNHITEKILRIAERSEPGPCPTCGGSLERLYLSRQQTNALRFPAVVLHQRSDGTYSFPPHADAPLSEGSVRVELRTFAEIDSAMSKVNQHERRKIEQRIELESAQLHFMEQRNRSDLRMRMQSMSQAGRDFAELAMQKNNERRPKTFEPNCYLQIREFDSSNREPQRDVKTGWKRGRD